MKRNSYWKLVLFLIGGAVAGSILTQVLKEVKALEPVLRATSIEWKPSADLGMIRYDLYILWKINLLTLLGMLGGYLLHKKI